MFCFVLFKTGFKSLRTLIPVEDAISMIQKQVFDFQMVIPNAHLIIDLLGLVFQNGHMSFDREHFQQIVGIIMGTNVATILANI